MRTVENGSLGKKKEQIGMVRLPKTVSYYGIHLANDSYMSIKTINLGSLALKYFSNKIWYLSNLIGSLNLINLCHDPNAFT